MHARILRSIIFFFFNDTATTEIYTLSLHDALPIRSASQPLAVAPTSRIHRVIVNTAATSGTGTLNSCAIGAMINRNAVKSKASRVHPAQAAKYAYHWSLVGSRHHAMGGCCTISTAAMLPSPMQRPVPVSLATTL